MNLINKKLNLLPLDEKIIPINITQKMTDKIKYLCKCIPAHEWSGVLFYSIEGSIKDLDTFKITLEDVYPMDKGTQGYTEYAFDETVVGYRMDNPETLSMNMGHIHSHNTMPTFFSGTDTGELTDNAPLHNYYLSVIVNNYLDFSIRLAMYAESESVVYKIKDEQGEIYNVNTPMKDEVVLYYNCKLEMEVEKITVLESFANRVKEIIEASKQKLNQIQQKMIGFNKNNGNNGKTTITVPTKQRKQQKKIEFKSDFQFSIDDYQIAIESFLIGLLGANYKPLQNSTISRELNSVLNILVLNIKTNMFPTYISETIASYTDIYEEYFIKGPNIEKDFAEDLDSCIDMLAQSEYSKTPLISMLIGSMENFQHQYHLAVSNE